MAKPHLNYVFEQSSLFRKLKIKRKDTIYHAQLSLVADTKIEHDVRKYFQVNLNLPTSNENVFDFSSDSIADIYKYLDVINGLEKINAYALLAIKFFLAEPDLSPSFIELFNSLANGNDQQASVLELIAYCKKREQYQPLLELGCLLLGDKNYKIAQQAFIAIPSYDINYYYAQFELAKLEKDSWLRLAHYIAAEEIGLSSLVMLISEIKSQQRNIEERLEQMLFQQGHSNKFYYQLALVLHQTLPLLSYRLFTTILQPQSLYQEAQYHAGLLIVEIYQSTEEIIPLVLLHFLHNSQKKGYNMISWILRLNALAPLLDQFIGSSMLQEIEKYQLATLLLNSSYKAQGLQLLLTIQPEIGNDYYEKAQILIQQFLSNYSLGHPFTYLTFDHWLAAGERGCELIIEIFHKKLIEGLMTTNIHELLLNKEELSCGGYYALGKKFMEQEYILYALLAFNKIKIDSEYYHRAQVEVTKLLLVFNKDSPHLAKLLKMRLSSFNFSFEEKEEIAEVYLGLSRIEKSVDREKTMLPKNTTRLLQESNLSFFAPHSGVDRAPRERMAYGF